MNDLIIIKNRISIFLSSFFLTSGIMLLFRKIQQKIVAKKVANHADLSNEIFEIISSLDLNIFPFYGTLLFLTREGSITFADDFDFATFDTIDVDHLVDSMRKRGAYPKGIIQDSFGKVYELTFDYKGCGIDLVFIKDAGNEFVHEFVNFRNELAEITHGKDTVSKKYSQIYRLNFSKFTLSHSSSLNLKLPNESESILSTIYGKDWRIPKKSNFIDYTKYNFIDREVIVRSGNIDDCLPKYVND